LQDSQTIYRFELLELRNRVIADEQEIEQILGKALGYPWYKDDQKNFPGTTEADGVCIGDHVAVTIAMEAADRITKLTTLLGSNP
jgi:hypothetical protein